MMLSNTVSVRFCRVKEKRWREVEKVTVRLFPLAVGLAELPGHRKAEVIITDWGW